MDLRARGRWALPVRKGLAWLKITRWLGGFSPQNEGPHGGGNQQKQTLAASLNLSSLCAVGQWHAGAPTKMQPQTARDFVSLAALGHWASVHAHSFQGPKMCVTRHLTQKARPGLAGCIVMQKLEYLQNASGVPIAQNKIRREFVPATVLLLSATCAHKYCTLLVRLLYACKGERSAVKRPDRLHVSPDV